MMSACEVLTRHTPLPGILPTEPSWGVAGQDILNVDVKRSNGTEQTDDGLVIRGMSKKRGRHGEPWLQTEAHLSRNGGLQNVSLTVNGKRRQITRSRGMVVGVSVGTCEQACRAGADGADDLETSVA
jgi:hypothetical protein